MSKFVTTTDRLPFAPVHPGIILAEEIAAREITANQLSKALDVPANRLHEIINGRRGITADTALRLAIYTGTSARFWMNLQSTYDLAVTEQTKGEKIAQNVRPAA